MQSATTLLNSSLSARRAPLPTDACMFSRQMVANGRWQSLMNQTMLCRYHFITTTCAIIGGVFTVAGIVDGLVHTGARFAKKVELGKHT